MAINVLDQEITPRYALYNGDCIDVMGSLPDKSVHISIYSPPFTGLYSYSSSERDLSNCRSYEEFFVHYEFVVKEILRLTVPGRISAVHCMDIPGNGANLGGNTIDFPGDVIRLHQRLGWHWACRYHVWKEPLKVRNRTMSKKLAHKQIVDDSSLCENAIADQLLIFRKKGDNPIPIAHPMGLSEYIGSRDVPHELLRYKNWKGNQIENRLSHWIWRNYASAFWDDVRVDRVLPYIEARDHEDQKHCHPLQLDVIERCLTLWSNPGEVVLTPFLGVGSEAFGAVRLGRKAVGIELKSTYFNQSRKNLATVDEPDQEKLLFDLDEESDSDLSVIDSIITSNTSEPTEEPEPSDDEPPPIAPDPIIDPPPVEPVIPAMYALETTKPKSRKKSKKESITAMFAEFNDE